jgi:hypothetical protein
MEYRKIIINSGLSVYEIEDLIDSWIFSERDRYILKRVLLDRISYEKVSEEIGLSVRQTKRIASSGMMVLIDHIKER